MNMLGSAARGRGRGRGRQLKVVSLQNNVMGPPTRPVLKRRGSSASAISSRINWKVGRSSNTRTATFSVTNSTVEVESTVILALTEGRGEAAGEVGIAAISTSHPSLILCQLSDSPSYMNTLTKINILNPTEILIPLTFANSFSTNRLVDKLKEQFRDIKITGVTRSTFNSNAGMEYLKRLCVPSMTSIFLVLQHKYYALSAAAALLTYTESTLYVFYAKESIKIDYQESEDSTIIDVATADRLELVASARPTIKKRYSCLLDVLNYCCTKIGVRTLRANILQPPCSVLEIEARLDCVTELMERSDMLFALQEILTKISNIDQLLILPTILPDHAESCSERQLNYLLTLNTVLEKIEPLYCIFENSQQPFFVELYKILSDTEFVVIKNTVRTMIHQNSYLAKGEQGAIQRCFAIKSGLNSVLDLMRKSYSERLEDMRKYVKTLSDNYGLALSLHNTNKKGYHIVLNLNVYQKRTFKRSDVPGEFIQVEQFTNNFTMKTQLLIDLSHRLEDIMSEILTMSNIMIHKLLIKTHQRMAIFYRLCEAIAKLDMLQSLAQASNTMHYTRPKFGDYLELEESYHPLLYYLCSNPVPNLIYASPDYNMNIITGPNGSGKSIYIRQVVLLQVMAQVGCYVPAHSATFRLCDRILARVYLEDNIHYGASAFVLEMTEIKYFFTVLTNKTLIIIDEMCRSTSVEEGTALAMAICERLLKTDAFVFFTTHYKHLANLSDLYYNIKTWQLETCSEMKNENMLLNFTYNTIPGVVSLEHYGIFLAKATWPESIMKYVYDVIALLMKSQKNTTIQHQKINEVARMKYDLEAEFKLLKSKKQLTRSIINEKVLNFQSTLQGTGHNAQICMDEKMDDSSIQESSLVGANEFLQIKVLAEVHNAPKGSTISNASQYTLCTPIPNSQDMLQTFDKTPTFNSNNDKRENNYPQLLFDNVQLSQIPSQSMMNLTPNEDGQVNISRAISQKITTIHNLEHSLQYSNTYESLMLLNKTENYFKSFTETPLFYNSSYLLATNSSHSEIDRTSQSEGTIYKGAQDSSLQNYSLMSDSAKVIHFNESIASLTESAFFMQLKENPERASTPIPTELRNQQIFEQQKLDASKPQTNSNSIKWIGKTIIDTKIKISSSNDFNDGENCSEYFSEVEWDQFDKEVDLQMQNQSNLEEQRSKKMKSDLDVFGVDDGFQEIERNFALLADEVESRLGGTTSPSDLSYGNKIRSSDGDKTSCKSSSIHFLEEDGSIKRKSNFDLSEGNWIRGNCKTSHQRWLETCQGSKIEKNSSEFSLSKNIHRGNTISILSSTCDESNISVLEEKYLKQISLPNKKTSNSTKTSSDDIKWGSTTNLLILNSNQPTSVGSVENPVSVPSNSGNNFECHNPRRNKLNENDPRLKKRYEYSIKTDIHGSGTNISRDPRLQVTKNLLPPNSSHSQWKNQEKNDSKDILLPSNSSKCGKYILQKSEKKFDHRNISNVLPSNSDRNKPEQTFFKDVIDAIPKMEFISNCSNSSKSSNIIGRRRTPNTLPSKMNKIYRSSNSTANFSNHSKLGNSQVTFSKWFYKSKNKVQHESTTRNLVLNRNQHDSSELEESSSKNTNNPYGCELNNDDSRSHDIINENYELEGKLLVETDHTENNYLNTLAHVDQNQSGELETNFPQDISHQTNEIGVNCDELTNALKDNVHQGLEGNQIKKINILSNIIIKPGRNFEKIELCSTDKNYNVEIEEQITREHVQKSNSTKNSYLEPCSPLKTELNNDNLREKNNSNFSKNSSHQASKVHTPLISNSGHSKWANSPRSNMLEYISPSTKNNSVQDNFESFTKFSTSNRDQNILEVNYDLGNFSKGDTNLKKTVVSGEIIRHDKKLSSTPNYSVEVVESSKNVRQNNSQVKIDKIRESFNQSLESLGNIHLELFSNCDTSDSSEENKRDSDDENEEPVENRTNRKRKRLDYASRTATKQKKDQSRRPKFVPPYKTENSTKTSSTATISSLSKKEIEQIYFEKNRKVLESNDVSLYLTEIMNRPSIRQLKQAEHIVTAYKTNEGVLVVPAKKKNYRKKKFIAPLKQSSGNFDVTIFSDKNSNKYQEIMNVSKDKNSRAGTAPFEIVSSEVVSKASRRSVFDKNESLSFSNSSFFNSLNMNNKPNQQMKNLDNSQEKKCIDSLLHKYLDTQSTDAPKEESVTEISSSFANANEGDFNSSFFSHTTIFNFD